VTAGAPAAPAAAGAARFARNLALTCFAGCIIVGAAAGTHAMRDRPPTAVTGGFGEPTCQVCHFEAEVDAGAGVLTLHGVPDVYHAGETYALTLTLVHPGVAAAGFEIAARFEKSAAQAGTLAPEPDEADRIGVTTDGDVQYAHHVHAGTVPVHGDTARWRLLWTAPPAGGAVVLHAAGNAANGDDSPLGDYVYSASATARPHVQPR
jgi:hypothetical protein